MSRNLGIDMGSSSIKILEQNDSGGDLIQAIVANPVGKNLMAMTNSEKMLIVDLLQKTLSAVGIRSKRVTVSLPESLVYAKVMRFPKMSTPELATAVRWELDQNVPFPPTEIEMSWSLMDGLKRKGSVDELTTYVVAVPSKVSEAYVQIFDVLEMEIEKLENESVSLQRSLTGFVPDRGLGLSVDFGYAGVNIMLFTTDSIVSSYYFSIGGMAMTKLISESFSLTLDQAENYKRTYGMVPDQLDGKMLAVLKPVMDNLILEIRKIIMAYRGDYGEFSSLRIVMTGGGSYTAGLPLYLSKSLDGVEVISGNVFEEKDVDVQVKPMGPVFAVANGLSVQI